MCSSLDHHDKSIVDNGRTKLSLVTIAQCGHYWLSEYFLPATDVLFQRGWDRFPDFDNSEISSKSNFGKSVIPVLKLNLKISSLFEF